MNFSIFKNWPPIYFYLISIVSFVFANIIRDKNPILYYSSLVFGVIFFVLGLTKRIKSK